MAKLLLLTNTFGGSSEVLPTLGLLSHQVRILPAEASILIEAPSGDVIFLVARRELSHAKSLATLLASTGLGAPLILIVTEGGLAAVSADWGMDDVILDTAGPAEVEARIRLSISRSKIALAHVDDAVFHCKLFGIIGCVGPFA